MSKKDPKQAVPVPDDSRPAKGVDEVAEASIESFPASDPPSFNPGTAAPQPAEEHVEDPAEKTAKVRPAAPQKPVR